MTVGDPAEFRGAAASLGVVPGLRQSRRRTAARAAIKSVNQAAYVGPCEYPSSEPSDAMIGCAAPVTLALIAATRKLLCVIDGVARNRKPSRSPPSRSKPLNIKADGACEPKLPLMEIAVSHAAVTRTRCQAADR